MKRSLGRVKSEHFLKKEVARLKKEVDNLVYNEKSFTENNEKVVFCTGLSTWELFHVLFQYIKPKLKQYSVLTPFQQLMITTMRLRLGLSDQDLAYRFKVSSATISRTFAHVIDVLYYQLVLHCSHVNKLRFYPRVQGIYRQKC